MFIFFNQKSYYMIQSNFLFIKMVRILYAIVDSYLLLVGSVVELHTKELIIATVL